MIPRTLFAPFNHSCILVSVSLLSYSSNCIFLSSMISFVMRQFSLRVLMMTWPGTIRSPDGVQNASCQARLDAL